MKEWFEKWFSNKLYLEIYKERDDNDARTLINLIQRNSKLKLGGKILDVCCGPGRHSVEFARRGYSVLGIDISAYLIKKALTALETEKEKYLKIKFEIADMRNFNYNNSFDAAVNIFSSFGYFENDIENFIVFDNIRLSLKKHGIFVFDFLNETYLRKNIVPLSKSKLKGKTIVQKRSIVGGFVFKYIYIDKIKKEPDFIERIRLYDYNKLTEIILEHGFKINGTFGDYYGNKFYKNKSERIIIFAEKK
ncbi:MAG: class I SAM-dependent methyltransferase [Ignavibacteria bacterium]|nr:class I SAM-dependent methyltransferase [Ignavibacteria bacterium]